MRCAQSEACCGSSVVAAGFDIGYKETTGNTPILILYRIHSNYKSFIIVLTLTRKYGRAAVGCSDWWLEAGDSGVYVYSLAASP